MWEEIGLRWYGFLQHVAFIIMIHAWDQIFLKVQTSSQKVEIIPDSTTQRISVNILVSKLTFPCLPIRIYSSSKFLNCDYTKLSTLYPAVFNMFHVSTSF